MKILQIVNTLSISDGGPARNAWELHQEIRKRFEHSELVSMKQLKRGGNQALVGQPSSRITPRSNLSKHPYFSGQSDSGGLAQIWQADVVFIHGYYLSWVPAVALLATLMGKKIVLCPHGSLTRYQSKKSAWKKMLWEFVLGWFVRARTALFLLGSEIEKTDLENKFPKTKSVVIGVGTNFPEVKTFPNLHSPIRLLSLSRIAPKKQIELSVELVRLLNARGIRSQLTIAGDKTGSYFEHLRAMVNDLSLNEYVEFIGPIHGDEKVSLYQDSDIFLLPSADENFGITVAEAAANGVPVIASEEVASATLIAGVGCRVIRGITAEKMFAAVKQLTENDFIHLRKTVLASARREFGWDAVAVRFSKAIHDLTANNG